jgi:hypothetical protein
MIRPLVSTEPPESAYSCHDCSPCLGRSRAPSRRPRPDDPTQPTYHPISLGQWCVEQKHGDANISPYICIAEGCSAVFQRADARLKHVYRKHPKLNITPGRPRRSTISLPYENTSSYGNCGYFSSVLSSPDPRQSFSAQNMEFGTRDKHIPSDALNIEGIASLYLDCIYDIPVMDRNLSISTQSGLSDRHGSKHSLVDHLANIMEQYLSGRQEVCRTVYVITTGVSEPETCYALRDLMSEYWHSPRRRAFSNGLRVRIIQLENNNGCLATMMGQFP